jgi:hypothetical protein
MAMRGRKILAKAIWAAATGINEGWLNVQANGGRVAKALKGHAINILKHNLKSREGSGCPE